jgi:hypothetical protein
MGQHHEQPHEQAWGENFFSLSTLFSPKENIVSPLSLRTKKTNIIALKKTYTHYPQP